ncbi:MAG: glycoside hydrolase [Armatimonadota bacterium]
MRNHNLENSRLKVTVDVQDGDISVFDKKSGYLWTQPKSDEKSNLPKPVFRDVQTLADGITFKTMVGWAPGSEFEIIVSLQLPTDTSDLVITYDLQDRKSKLNMLSLDPFIPNTPDSAIMAADGCDGHIYPIDIKEFPGASMGLRNLSWYPADRLDMPWVGVCDLEKGAGYAMIIDTSDDAIVNCKQYKVEDRQFWLPKMIWLMSMNRFSYQRKLIYRFVPSGGYVSIAKAYRSYAESEGMIVPFTEKVKQNPNIKQLFGAPSVWGLLDLNAAKEAKTSGVDRMLMQRLGDWFQKRCSPEDIKAINDLGYLTGEYDNYVDIYPAKPGDEITNNHGIVPDDTALTHDGEPMKAWWDGTQYATKRCPSLYGATVDTVLGRLLKTYPFTARFLDVVAAQDLFECNNLRHPLSKGGSRMSGIEHFKAAQKHNLVVGAEHGIWWAVPYVDYFEGIMSGGMQSWSSGYLEHPKSKDDSATRAPGEKLPAWDDYAKWGIGHEYRIPLWELVFHDCTSTTWYWGDSNDWLLDAAPEVTAKKDAFNILYGNRPILWSDTNGSWKRDRSVFMRSYRNTCKFNEVIADKVMLSHEFLTEDRSVQKSIFSDGTQVIVNFGENPYKTKLAGREYILPQNGFAVHGPEISQSLGMIDGKPVTRIKMKNYLFTDESGTGITVQKINNNHIRVNIDSHSLTITVTPDDVTGRWSFNGMRIYELNKLGERIGEAKWNRSGKRSIVISPGADSLTFDLIHN